MVWWLRHGCASMRFWVQSLMDVYINLSCTNVVYKHVHHGKWCKKNFVEKIGTKKNFKVFSQHVTLSWCAMAKMQYVTP